VEGYLLRMCDIRLSTCDQVSQGQKSSAREHHIEGNHPVSKKEKSCRRERGDRIFSWEHGSEQRNAIFKAGGEPPV